MLLLFCFLSLVSENSWPLGNCENINSPDTRNTDLSTPKNPDEKWRKSIKHGDDDSSLDSCLKLSVRAKQTSVHTEHN